MNYLIVRRNDTLEYKQIGLGTKLFLYMAISLLDQALENESRKQHKSCLEINQIQAKWERLYDFAIYKASENGWICSVCSEYGDGDENWRTKAIQLWEHPTRTFEGHKNSKKHKDSAAKRADVKRTLSRGGIYRQKKRGDLVTKERRKAINCRVIKKFIKTTYFIARKKWAVRENFEDVINFVGNLGDEDISYHLREGSRNGTYTSRNSVDSFLTCLSDYLEKGFLDRLVNAVDFSILCDETTDMADRADLSIFVRYVNPSTKLVTEEFLGLVEIIGSKGAEALCNKIQEVLKSKGIDISLMRFHGMDGTNTMSGERTGLQRRLSHYLLIQNT